MRARFPVLAALGLAALLVPVSGPVAAGEAELGKYVPAGIHFYGSFMSNEATQQFEKPYLDAFGKLVDSGIGEDIFELATMELPEQKRQFIRAQIDTGLKLLSGPDWSALASEEFSFAFRISIPIPEYIFLFRGEAGTADARFAELREMLEGFAKFAPDVLSVTESTLVGAKVARLGMGEVPFGLLVASKKDTVLISTSDILLDNSLRLMDAEDASGSIVESQRFRDAQAGMPPGSTARTYFDLGGYIGFIRGMMGMAQGAAGFQPGGREQAILSLVNTFFDELSRLETISSADRVEGRQYISDIRLALAQRDGPGFIEKLIAEQEPIRDFHRVVPKDAVNFFISSGIDPETIYDVALAYLEERVPDGESVAQQWEGIQQAIGFHLKNDLLSWIDGGCGCITLPGRAGGSSECVFLLRLKDEEKAKRFLKAASVKVKGFLESRDQKVEFARLAGEIDLHEVRIDALPWCRPVIGVPGGVLVVASSAGAANRVLETFKGDAPSIREHPRFAKLNVPDAPLTEVYYYDVEGSLTAFANVLGTIGFVASLVPEHRDTRPAIKVGAILTKFAAFLRDVDLSLYSAGWSRYDGEKHQVMSRMVTGVKGR